MVANCNDLHSNIWIIFNKLSNTFGFCLGIPFEWPELLIFGPLLYSIAIHYSTYLSLSRSVSVCVYLFSTLDVCIYHLLCINLIKLLLSIRKFIGLIIFIAFWVSFVAVNAEDVLYIASSKKRLSSRFGAVHTRSYVLMRNMTVAREQLAQCTCTCTDS